MPRQTWIQNAFNAGELSPYLEGRTDVTKYSASAKTIENFHVRPAGGLTRRSGTRFVLSCKSNSARSRLIPFIFSNVQAYVLEFSNNLIRVFKDEGVVLSGPSPLEIVTTYTTAQLPDMAFAQSNDTLYIVHPEHAPAKLTRSSHTSWTLSDIAFFDGPWLPENTTDITITSNGNTGNVTLTASSALFAATDVGRQIRLRPDGFSPYDKAGWATITGFTSTTQVTAAVDADSPLDVAAVATKRWRLGAFGSAATVGYPRAVTFFEQRLLFAGNPAGPQTVYGSKNGDYENFAPTTDMGPSSVDQRDVIRDDNGYTYTIASNQVQNILWMNPIRSLVIGTDSGIWTLQASSAGEAVTPTNVQVKRTTVTGSASVPAVNVDDELLFISDTSRRVLKVGYEFERDSYTPVDLSLYADHIGKSGIVETAYAHEPNTTAYLVRGDGVLVGATYLREQSVIGFSRHILGGTFGGGDAVVESVAVIPSPNADHDQVWITVKRTINSNTARYIEFFEEEFGEDSEQEDAFFVDSGLSYDGAPATAISGLSHLEGETVKVLADGAVVPDAVVTGGAITLATAASVVHVGLGYDSNLQMFRVDTEDSEGSAQIKVRRGVKAWIRFHRTIGGFIGVDADNLDEMMFRDASDPMTEPVPFFTGDYEHVLESAFDTKAGLYVRQSIPLPMNILLAAQSVWQGDR